MSAGAVAQLLNPIVNDVQRVVQKPKVQETKTCTQSLKKKLKSSL